MASVQEPDFMKGPRTPVEGLKGTSEARALAVERFPKKPYCLVRDWTIFRIEVTRDELCSGPAPDDPVCSQRGRGQPRPF